MLGRLDRDDVADLALGLGATEIHVERRVAQDEPDHQIVGAVLRDERRQLHCLFDRGDHRLFREDLHAAVEAGADVLEMQVIRRADHQQVELCLVEHRLEAVVLLPDGNTVLLGVG